MTESNGPKENRISGVAADERTLPISAVQSRLIDLQAELAQRRAELYVHETNEKWTRERIATLTGAILELQALAK